MKIESIESYFVGGGYLIRIRTDTGLTGLGQTACWGYPEAVHQIVERFKNYLIGQNPFRIEHHWQYLYRMSPFRGSALSGAISAVGNSGFPPRISARTTSSCLLTVCMQRP